MQEEYLQPKNIDDELSKQMFDFYLAQIDPNKEFLTQKDLLQLQKYETQIDEELKNGTFYFFNEALKQLQKGIHKAEKYGKKALKSELDLYFNEQLETNPKKLDYAVDNQALKERWRKKIKYAVLTELWSLGQLYPDISFEERKKRAVKQAKSLLDSKLRKINSWSQEERLHSLLPTFGENLRNQDKKVLFEGSIPQFKKRFSWIKTFCFFVINESCLSLLISDDNSLF